MPYIIVQTRWPSEAIPAVVKKAIEVVAKYPQDESLGEQVVPNAVKATLDGIITMGVYLVKEGKFEEAMARTIATMAMYGPVPGFEYSIETWATQEEAYGAIGQTPPE
ncbi:MAG: hypothetical protein ACFE94_04030 [Candidatus Hodarchaeota archaeon]